MNPRLLFLVQAVACSVTLGKWKLSFCFLYLWNRYFLYPFILSLEVWQDSPFSAKICYILMFYFGSQSSQQISNKNIWLRCRIWRYIGQKLGATADVCVWLLTHTHLTCTVWCNYNLSIGFEAGQESGGRVTEFTLSLYWIDCIDCKEHSSSWLLFIFCCSVLEFYSSYRFSL